MLLLLATLEAIQVAILWSHDLVPLGPLNDTQAVRQEDSAGRLLITTIVQSAPFTFGLAWSVVQLRSGFAGWLWTWLWVSYGVLFLGELRAWWWPYLVRAEPARAARYHRLFGRTHAFLPERNGVVPNTLHCGLHAATVATLVALAVLHRAL